MIPTIKINLGGKDRVLKFNQYCLIHIATVLKVDPLNITEKLSKITVIRALNVVIYGGIMGYVEEQADYDNDVKIQEVTQWVIDADKNQFEPIWEAFKQAMGISKILEKYTTPDDETDKKKVQ